jgi:hypothetical protein
MSLIVVEIPDDCPTCDKCGAPVTTGLMAVLCPFAEQCAFWPAEGIDEGFLLMFRGTVSSEEVKP